MSTSTPVWVDEKSGELKGVWEQFLGDPGPGHLDMITPKADKTKTKNDEDECVTMPMVPPVPDQPWYPTTTLLWEGGNILDMEKDESFPAEVLNHAYVLGANVMPATDYLCHEVEDLAMGAADETFVVNVSASKAKTLGERATASWLRFIQ